MNLPFACIGIYGIMAHNVVRVPARSASHGARTRIRQVRWTIFRESSLLARFGIARRSCSGLRPHPLRPHYASMDSTLPIPLRSFPPPCCSSSPLLPTMVRPVAHDALINAIRSSLRRSHRTSHCAHLRYAFHRAHLSRWVAEFQSGKPYPQQNS